jgi:hypothetical protein
LALATIARPASTWGSPGPRGADGGGQSDGQAGRRTDPLEPHRRTEVLQEDRRVLNDV